MDNNGLQNSNTQAQPEESGAVVSRPNQHTKLPKVPQESKPETKVATTEKLLKFLGSLVHRLGLNLSMMHVKWSSIIGYGLFSLAVILLLGDLLYSNYMNGMNMKSVTVGGYVYSFQFLRSAKFEQNSNGMRGYSADSDHSVIIGPISGLSELCGSNGDPYTVAFSIQVNGIKRPVCTAQDSQDEQMFMLTFTAQNQFHECIVTYGFTQNTNVDEKMKSILESINVSK